MTAKKRNGEGLSHSRKQAGDNIPYSEIGGDSRGGNGEGERATVLPGRPAHSDKEGITLRESATLMG